MARDFVPEWVSEFEPDLKAGRFRAAVIAMIKARDWVTFVEVANLLTDHMPVKGDMCMMLGPAEGNIAIWAGMSDEFYDLMDGLVRDKSVFLHPASFLSYMIDGGGLSLPLASGRRDSYKKLHWFPVCLRDVPLPPIKKSAAAKKKPKK